MGTNVPKMDDVTEEKFFLDYVWARVTGAFQRRRFQKWITSRMKTFQLSSLEDALCDASRAIGTKRTNPSQGKGDTRILCRTQAHNL